MPAESQVRIASNTNYVLLVQRATGRPIGEEITHRVIDPLGLGDTYWPGLGEQQIRGTHPHGYLGDGPDGAWRDITDMDPSLGWAAGQLVSTPSDLGRFMQGLLDGELLAPAQLAQMQHTVRRRTSSRTPAGATDSAWPVTGSRAVPSPGATAVTSRASRPATWRPRTAAGRSSPSPACRRRSSRSPMSTAVSSRSSARADPPVVGPRAAPAQRGVRASTGMIRSVFSS